MCHFVPLLLAGLPLFQTVEVSVTLEMKVGAKLVYRSITNEPFKSIDNPDGKIVNVQATKDLREVQIEALAEGKVVLTMVDAKDAKSKVKVIVRGKAAKDPPGKSVAVIEMNIGETFVYRTISNENLKSVDNPNGKLINITPTKDLRVIRIEALEEGTAIFDTIDVKDAKHKITVIIKKAAK